MKANQILVAGMGNIFFGDDAFGVEVVRYLRSSNLPDKVVVIDFGIRSYDLAYAILEEYQAVILVDATQRGKPPGTLYLLKPDLSQLDTLTAEFANAHSMNPVEVLRMVKALGGCFNQLYLVGCEPAVLETNEGTLGLSTIVEAVVPEASNMIIALINQIILEETL